MDHRPTLKLAVGARSDIGLRRKDNQDSGYAGDNLLLIADGVGGNPAGDLASALVVRTLADGLSGLGTVDEDTLREQIAVANAQISDTGRENPELRGMATTMTGLVLAGDRGFIMHVGDSRAYRWRGGSLEPMTADQSWIQMLLDEGLVDPVTARRHPLRNMLLHSLSGSLGDPEHAQIYPVDLQAGDRWLLATDGLTSYASPEAVADLISDLDDPQELAERLVELSRPLSRDNISAVVGEVTSGLPHNRGRFVGAAAKLSHFARHAV